MEQAEIIDTFETYQYGGCFEEDIMRLMYERVYHPKDFDAPVKFAPTLKMRKGNARYRRG